MVLFLSGIVFWSHQEVGFCSFQGWGSGLIKEVGFWSHQGGGVLISSRKWGSGLIKEVGFWSHQGSGVLVSSRRWGSGPIRRSCYSISRFRSLVPPRVEPASW